MTLPGGPAVRRVPGWVNAGQVGLVFLVAGVVVAIGWPLVGDAPIARQAVVWVANLAMLVAIGFFLRRRHETWEHIGLPWRFGGWRATGRAVAQAVVVVVAALGGFLAGSLLATLPAGPAQQADLSGYAYLEGRLPMLLAALAAVYVVSSFGEEVVYRGFLMTRVAEMGRFTRAAWGIAVVTSAIVFGLAHFDWGVVGVVQTTCMGFALSGAYLLVGRNLWVLVLAHGAIDTTLFVQLYFGSSGPSS